MSSSVEASVSMVKNCTDNLHSTKNTEDLIVKQMFDISEKLMSEQSDEIYGISTIYWENSSWKYLSLVNEEVVSLPPTKGFMYFQILYYVLERWTRIQHQILFGSDSWDGSKIHHNTEFWTHRRSADGIRLEYFPQDPPHCSLTVMSKSSCQKWAYNQKFSLDGLSACRCPTTSHGDLKTMNRNAN